MTEVYHLWLIAMAMKMINWAKKLWPEKADKFDIYTPEIDIFQNPNWISQILELDQFEQIESLRLVRRYGLVLEVGDTYIGGLRDRNALPCDIEVLKAAILEVAAFGNSDIDESLLKSAYLNLSHFLADNPPLYGLHAGNHNRALRVRRHLGHALVERVSDSRSLAETYPGKDEAETIGLIEIENRIFNFICESRSNLEIEWAHRLSIAKAVDSEIEALIEQARSIINA